MEFDDAAAFDGLADFVEIVAPFLHVFVGETFDLYALGELLVKEAAVDLGQQVLYAAESGEAFDVLVGELAEFGGVEAVIAAALFVPFEKAEAFVEVALYGADVDSEFFGEPVHVEAFAAVEAAQDFSKTVGELFVSAAHGFPLVW